MMERLHNQAFSGKFLEVVDVNGHSNVQTPMVFGS